jgi:hypothetical protein
LIPINLYPLSVTLPISKYQPWADPILLLPRSQELDFIAIKFIDPKLRDRRPSSGQTENRTSLPEKYNLAEPGLQKGYKAKLNLIEISRKFFEEPGISFFYDQDRMFWGGRESRAVRKEIYGFWILL